MYCTNCGNELEEDMKFCTKCGTPVAGNIATEEPVKNPVGNEVEKNRNRCRILRRWQ